MGLHNRYPSYFYKRGNLFNTYLGYSDDQGVPEQEQKRRSRPKRAETAPCPPAQRTSTPPQPKPRGEATDLAARLARFATQHLTLEETRRLLRLIATNEGITINDEAELDSNASLKLERFVRDHLAPQLAARYLHALNGRLARGEPLIQR